MLPYAHLLIGLIVSGGLYFIFPEIDLIKAGIILASSVLIDFDHYLFYVAKKKDFGVKRAYNWFLHLKKEFKKLSKEQRKAFPIIPSIFHGIEWIFLFSVLGWWVWDYFFFIAAGMLLHLLTDLIEHIMYPNGLHKISVIRDILKYRKSKKIE